MSGFVPMRDRVTIDNADPDQVRRAQATDAAEQRAALDKAELADVERAQTGATTPRRKRTLIDRLLRRA